MSTNVSQKNFGFKNSNTKSIQHLLDSNDVNLGNAHGDELGLDAVSPRGHIITNTIDDANTYHHKSKSLLDSRVP